MILQQLCLYGTQKIYITLLKIFFMIGYEIYIQKIEGYKKEG